jgi:hypothetical protein
MKKIKFYLALMAACLVFIIITGCTTVEKVPQPDGTTQDVFVPDPRIADGVNVVRATNTASAPFNPFAYWIELGLSAVTAGSLWVAKRKNDKASADAELLKVVIQAIDALDDDKAKEVIQKHATSVGVEGRLNSRVQQVGAGLI